MPFGEKINMANDLIFNTVFFAIMLFLMSIVIALSTRNILKIFISLEIMITTSILLLEIWQGKFTSLEIFLTCCAFLFGICGLIVIHYIYQKFKTLDIKQIYKLAQNVQREEK